MGTSLDQFLRQYVVFKRLTAVVCALCLGTSIAIASMLVLAFLDRWLMLGSGFRASGLVFAGIAGLAILIPRLWSLFRRIDPVLEAIQIEQQRPAFDQRLITVASDPSHSPMLDQLRREVEALAATIPIKSLLPWRSLWICVLMLAIAAGALVGLSGRLPLRRIYSPMPASSKMNSTSTAASRGNTAAPIAARA
jgi:hypothetical protein